MVDPTNLKPRFIRSLLILSDNSVFAGISERAVRLEMIESIPEILTLMQNGPPAQAGLERIQYNKLKPFPVVMNRVTPLGIMILKHLGVVGRPFTG